MKNQYEEMMTLEQFPLSAKYDPQWILENEMGPNALWLMEWLCEAVDLKPGMRILDMGCGKAMTSIFLAKEFGVQVWANDLWIPATENWQRIREASVADSVFPIHAEAHALPYADSFFDAIVSADAYHYFGTNDLYLGYFAKFLREGGQLGIVVPGLVREFQGGEIPQHLQEFLPPDQLFSFHTVEWWRWHWEKTQLVDIERADTQPDGWRYWLLFRQAGRVAAGTTRSTSGGESETLRADQGQYLGFVRIVARNKTV